MGTLFIPNTLALIRGSANGAAAEQLLDYLLSPPVEERLARGPSAQIPLNAHVNVAARVATPRDIRAMQIDFDRAADQWEEAAQFLQQLFATAD